MAGKSREGGLLDGITTLVEKLQQLAEQGEELKKFGEISGFDKVEGLKGVSGVNVRVGHSRGK
jgi:hypothetical protein